MNQNAFPLTQALIRSAGFDVERRLTRDPRVTIVGSATKPAQEPPAWDSDLTLVEAFDRAMEGTSLRAPRAPKVPCHFRWNDPEYWADRFAYFLYRVDQDAKKAAN